MVEIEILKNDIAIKGHTDSKVYQAISTVAQYMCSNLDITNYECNYGELKASFISNDVSKLLISNFIRFILALKSTEVYLIDKR